MLRSSLGFHTITLSLNLENKEVEPLIKHFDKYRRKTGLIETYLADIKGKNIQVYRPSEDKEYFITPLYTNIIYHKKYTGIKWSIRCNCQNEAFKSHFVEVTINPKILSGINDYITAATYDDMETAIKNFNNEAKSISRILKDFHHYNLKRVDYCINFALNDLAPGCSPEQIMKLIKRANIPTHYKEWKEYDTTAHRIKSKNSSFYLTNSSANINCYMKHVELQERSQKYRSRGYSQITQEMVDESLDIIRFEVQFKYLRMYNLNHKAEDAGNHKTNKYESLLTNEMCSEIISDYYKKSIGKGDWYSLQTAIRTVQSSNFNSQKEKRLIDALKFVNECNTLADAKSAFKGDNLKKFKRTLSDLSCLGINPVTIPKNWGIKHIPNLLYAYFDKISDEIEKKTAKEFWSKELNISPDFISPSLYGRPKQNQANIP